MTTRIRIYPYKQGSKSAKALAQGLGGKVLKLEGSTFQCKPTDRVINWGSTQCPASLSALNNSQLVSAAGNKLLALRAMKEAGVSVPEFAASVSDVSWEGTTVVRHKLTGHSGAGIVIYESEQQELPQAPLYVQYIKKRDEYRVHIIGGNIVAVQRKARDPSNPSPNWQVRNHDNGFIFVRQGFETPGSVKEQAHAAIQALSLDFGAVDIIWNEKQKKPYVLEVNTAPGLEGQTVTDYINGFQEIFN